MALAIVAGWAIPKERATIPAPAPALDQSWWIDPTRCTSCSRVVKTTRTMLACHRHVRKLLFVLSSGVSFVRGRHPGFLAEDYLSTSTRRSFLDTGVHHNRASAAGQVLAAATLSSQSFKARRG